MKLILSIVILFLLNTLAMAAPDLHRKADFSVLTRPDTGYQFHTLNFTSADGQRHYRVYVGVPQKPAPSAGFPVFYSLDGNAMLEELTSARLRGLVRQPNTPVIVMLGYATDLRLDVDARAFDYTPANPRLTEPAPENGRRLGGAPWFLTLIAQQIQPTVAKMAPINPHEQTLFGHSYGGLFVLYALLHHPSLFQHYIAADPSVWVQQGIILNDAHRFMRQRRSLPPTTLWVMRSDQADPPHKERAGSKEEQQFLATRHLAMREVGANAADNLSSELGAGILGLSVSYEVSLNDTHGSLFAKSFRAALFNQPLNFSRDQKEKP